MLVQIFFFQSICRKCSRSGVTRLWKQFLTKVYLDFKWHVNREVTIVLVVGHSLSCCKLMVKKHEKMHRAKSISEWGVKSHFDCYVARTHKVLLGGGCSTFYGQKAWKDASCKVHFRMRCEIPFWLLRCTHTQGTAGRWVQHILIEPNPSQNFTITTRLNTFTST